MAANSRFLIPTTLLIGLSTGCMSFSDRGFRPVTEDMARQAPQLEMRKEFAISIGSALINTVVRAKESFERTWVLVGIDEHRQTIEAVSVLNLEQGELVPVHVDGELQEMIEFAFDPVRGERGAFSFS